MKVPKFFSYSGYNGFPISIDFYVDFLDKVEIGQKLRVLLKNIRESRNIIHTNIEIRDMKNKMISTSNSNLLKTQFISAYVKNADKLKK